ncbi:MAG: GGDEF domain-containing protein [Candidatus Woesearchaeota archaeon]
MVQNTALNLEKIIDFQDAYNRKHTISDDQRPYQKDKEQYTHESHSQINSVLNGMLDYLPKEQHNSFIEMYNKSDENQKQLLISLYSNMQKDICIDHLTNLPNRKCFDKDLSQKIESVNRDKNKQLNLLTLDIDYFKQINDTYGHDFGDFVLKKCGEYLKKNIRESDNAYRLGGEEFSLLLDSNIENKIDFNDYFNNRITGVSDYIINEIKLEKGALNKKIKDLKSSNADLSNLNGNLSKLKIFNKYLINLKKFENKINEGSYSRINKDKNDPYITFSVGSSVYNKSLNNENYSKSPGELINRADQALYIAKANGRNKICYK